MAAKGEPRGTKPTEDFFWGARALGALIASGQLSDNALAVYVTLCMLHGRRQINPSVNWLATHTHRSTRSVQRALRELEALGLIRRIQRPLSGGGFDSNVYALLVLSA